MALLMIVFYFSLVHVLLKECINSWLSGGQTILNFYMKGRAFFTFAVSSLKSRETGTLLARPCRCPTVAIKNICPSLLFHS